MNFTLRPVNTSGKMVRQELEYHRELRPIWERYLPNELADFDAIVEGGLAYEDGLREIVHLERDPRRFPHEEMRGWLHHAFKTRRRVNAAASYWQSV